MSDPRTPSRVRAADRRQRQAGVKTAARGFIEGDTVYVVASALATRAQALETIAHECIGHWGLRRFFGDRLDGMLDALCISNREQVVAKASSYGLDVLVPEQLREAAEEVLAELASDSSHPSLVMRLEGAVRSLLRSLVPSMRDEPYSKSELISKFILPVRARLSMMSAVQQAQAGQRELPTESGVGKTLSKFSAWFGASKVVDPDGEPMVVFHGTHASFDSFEANDRGLFFGEDPTLAASHSGVRKGGTPNVMPVYLAIENPWQIIKYGDDVPYSTMIDQSTKALKSRGYDGVHDPSRGVWIAFEPSQVKSAIGNNGDYDRENPDIRFDRGGVQVDAPIYRSELHARLRESPSRNTPGGWLGYLGALAQKGVSAEEVEWSGLMPWLRDLAANHPKDLVTQDQVLDRFETYGVRVDDVMLEDVDQITQAIEEALTGTGFSVAVDETVTSGSPFLFHDSICENEVVPLDELPTAVAASIDAILNGQAPRPSRYKEHSMPGGTNYRELLLTLGVRASVSRHIEDSLFVKGRHVVNVNGVTHDFPGRPAADAFVATLPSTPSYASPHWAQPNVLAHVRLNERTDVLGRRVLFVEEIQSDWSQEGRRVGFHDPGPVEIASVVRLTKADRQDAAGQPYTADTADHWGAYDANDRFIHEIAYPTVLTEADARRVFQDLIVAGVIKHETRPKAPFVMSTTAWVGLALRRVLKLAVDEGFAAVAFTSGEQNAVRGRQDKRIGQVKAIRLAEGLELGFAGSTQADVDAKSVVIEVRDPFGKLIYSGVHPDSALPVIIGDDLAAKVTLATEAAGQLQEFKGLDVRVRGEGMRTFYDSIVPNALKGVLRKLGCGGEGRGASPSPVSSAQIHVGGPNEFCAQLTVAITPDMTSKLASGVPMFCRGEEGSEPDRLRAIWNDLGAADRSALLHLVTAGDAIVADEATEFVRPRMTA